MTTRTTPTLLQRALFLDAGVSGATGVLMVAASGPLSGLLGLPVPLLQWAGLILIPFALLLMWLATRNPIPRVWAWGVVGVNALWALDSVLLLMTGWVDPTVLGYVFTVGQALVVLGFAELQFMGLRRMQAAFA